MGLERIWGEIRNQNCLCYSMLKGHFYSVLDSKPFVFGVLILWKRVNKVKCQILVIFASTNYKKTRRTWSVCCLWGHCWSFCLQALILRPFICKYLCSCNIDFVTPCCQEPTLFANTQFSGRDHGEVKFHCLVSAIKRANCAAAASLIGELAEPPWPREGRKNP